MSVYLPNSMPAGEKTKLLWQDPEYRKRMSGAHKGNETCFKKGHKYRNTGRTRFKKGEQLGEANTFFGKEHSLASKLKMSKSKVKQGFTFANGYKKTLVSLNTYQADHRIIVEQVLERPLLSREVVHHIDKDKTNNDLSNLFLFRHNMAHLRWHRFINRHKLNPTILESNLCPKNI